jgi:hypothetical protein
MNRSNLPRPLSKSKLVAFRQCPKRLWLEIHHPELREDSSATQSVFRTGHELGALAQRLYDPDGRGAVIDLRTEGVIAAVRRTKELLKEGLPIFEAGFSAEGALAFADVMLPTLDGDHMRWRMVEVKSSTSVKPYQADDVAIQSFAARKSGIDLAGVSIAHINRDWVYPGGGDYRGLLIEQDMTDPAFSRWDEVSAWITSAQEVAARSLPPAIELGAHCDSPFSCGFKPHCESGRAEVEFPVEWLPRLQSKTVKDLLAGSRIRDMREIPDELLTTKQRKVRDCTLTGREYFDAEGARQDLSPYGRRVSFLDFETIQFGIPRWAGTRPFQMIPFQFSLHTMDEAGILTHQGFLDLSGDDPSEAFASSLIEACSEPMPIFVYNAGFEGSRLSELGARFPSTALALRALRDRLVDLLPIAESRYYHPSQQGSWSIKKLLPAIAPELAYQELDGVQDGGMAMEAYLEATDSITGPERAATINHQLVEYCKLDTLAMVKVWRKFSQNS